MLKNHNKKLINKITSRVYNYESAWVNERKILTDTLNNLKTDPLEQLPLELQIPEIQKNAENVFNEFFKETSNPSNKII